jgi:hypothetical protein
VAEQPLVSLCAEQIERNSASSSALIAITTWKEFMAELKHGAYREKWFKIRSPGYSQYEGERQRAARTCVADLRQPERFLHICWVRALATVFIDGEPRRLYRARDRR